MGNYRKINILAKTRDISKKCHEMFLRSYAHSPEHDHKDEFTQEFITGRVCNSHYGFYTCHVDRMT